MNLLAAMFSHGSSSYAVQRRLRAKGEAWDGLDRTLGVREGNGS
jgi:hypothetical protein